MTETVICPECGEAFDRGDTRAKKCGKPECHRARKRRLYRTNDKQRAQAIARAKAWNLKNRSRINDRNRATRASGTAPWYMLLNEDLPQPLADLRRAYAFFHKRRKGDPRDTRAYERIAGLMRTARKIHEWSDADLAKIDKAVSLIRQERTDA